MKASFKVQLDITEEASWNVFQKLLESVVYNLTFGLRNFLLASKRISQKLRELIFRNGLCKLPGSILLSFA